MTTEQAKELAEALSVVSAQSSVLKERDELRALMEENLAADEVSITDTKPSYPGSKLHSGSQVTFWRFDQENSVDVNEDRCSIAGL